MGTFVRSRHPFHNVDLPQSRRGLAWKTIESARAGFIGEATKRVRRTLSAIKDLAVREVRMSGIARLAVPAVRDLMERQRPKIEDMYRDLYVMVGTRFAERTAEQLGQGKSVIGVPTKQDEEDPPPGVSESPGGVGVGFPQGTTASRWSQEVERILQDEGGDLITNVTETTKNDIMQQVRAGVEEGEGIERIARRIDENVEQSNRNRARTIGRTETIRASNAATTTTAENLDIDVEKEWIVTLDSRVRPSHLEADAQVVPKDSSFTVGGFPAQYPSDPALPARESVNCRCTVSFHRV